MTFTKEENRAIQKAIAETVKEIRGVGPKSHSFYCVDNEMHMLLSGTLSSVEKYLYATFGQEYSNAVFPFYFELAKVGINRIDEKLMGKYHLELISWEPDYLNDKVEYIVKVSV